MSILKVFSDIINPSEETWSFKLKVYFMYPPASPDNINPSINWHFLIFPLGALTLIEHVKPRLNVHPNISKSFSALLVMILTGVWVY